MDSKSISLKYEELKSRNLKLDISRGKPSPEQLDFSMPLLSTLTKEEVFADGCDCRNYGFVDGLPGAKQFFGQMLKVSPDDITVYGNSSLNIMYNVVSNAVTHGILGSRPWGKYEKPVKFLCPVPGYDRHFSVCEYFGIEMISIEMNEDGPDMDTVEKLVSQDGNIKGIWCVPRYSNPTGIIYSDEVIKRLAALNPKAYDFRIYYDNAYAVHHLTENPVPMLNIADECKKNGTENLVYQFASTSKITFSGGGVCALNASKENLKSLMKPLTVSTIGYDKINQLRHIKFLNDPQALTALMEQHRRSLVPKFNTVLNTLERELEPLGLGRWHKPQGGYFISFDGRDNTAKETVRLCKEAGLVLTPAGATFPYGKDPHDRNIRIAPTFPSVDELQQAMDLFCTCVKLVNCQKL
jgi:DNA-binding transcriptional MocR family regulator